MYATVSTVGPIVNILKMLFVDSVHAFPYRLTNMGLARRDVVCCGCVGVELCFTYTKARKLK